MTEEFMKANRERLYFNYTEIINQVFSEELLSNGNEYYRTRMEIISKILKNLGIDMSIYEISYNTYEIPIHLAELIFVIAKWIEENGSYQNSTISYLKRNKFSDISIGDRIEIISNYFDEIAKDYPKTASTCLVAKEKFLTPYFHYINLDLIVDKLTSIRDNVELPLISYDKSDTDNVKRLNEKLSKYADNKVNYIYEEENDDGDIEQTIMEIPIPKFDEINQELLYYLNSLKGTSGILTDDIEIDDCYEEMTNAIEHLEKIINKMNLYKI